MFAYYHLHSELHKQPYAFTSTHLLNAGQFALEATTIQTMTDFDACRVSVELNKVQPPLKQKTKPTYIQE